MLNGMTRNARTGERELEAVAENDGDEDDDGDDLRDSADKKRKRAQKLIRSSRGGEERTLDKESNLNMTNFDCQHEVDPLFRKTTQKFDEMGLSSLLSGTLSATSSLLVQLDSRLSYAGKEMD